MKRIAVLISNKGTGTNLQAIIDGVKSGKIKGLVSIVVSDAKDAYGLKRAKKHGIKTLVVKGRGRLEKILKEKYDIDYVALGGWKQIIPGSFIKTFHNRVLNVHPGLIPDAKTEVVRNPDGTNALWNKGKFTEKAIQNFFDSTATYAGSSIHFLTNDVDFGPVLARGFVKIQANDTVESLYARVKKKENEMYVRVLSKLCR